MSFIVKLAVWMSECVQACFILDRIGPTLELLIKVPGTFFRDFFPLWTALLDPRLLIIFCTRSPKAHCIFSMGNFSLIRLKGMMQLWQPTIEGSTPLNIGWNWI